MLRGQDTTAHLDRMCVAHATERSEVCVWDDRSGYLKGTGVQGSVILGSRSCMLQGFATYPFPLVTSRALS